MNSRSAADLLNPLRGPLNAEDIALIEEEMDRLLVDMFINNEKFFVHSYEALEHDLKMDVRYKLQGFLDIVTQIEKNVADASGLHSTFHPGLRQLMHIDPSFGEQLRGLLKLVDAYYHSLN